MNLIWITKAGYCKAAELSPGVLDSWIAHRRLIKGVHYKVIGKTTFVNWQELDKWVSESGHRGSAPAAKDCELESTKAASASTQKRSRVTHIQKLSLNL